MSDLKERVEWRCFHCGEVFTDERCARQHFGRDEESTVACIIKGADGGLLRALRNAEEQADDAIQAMHSESTDAARAYHHQRCRHTSALMAAEEAGYERGMDDARSEAVARIEKLEAALEPFAKMGRMLEGPFAPALFKDADSFVSGGAWRENGEARTLTFGDFRRAAQALQSGEARGV